MVKEESCLDVLKVRYGKLQKKYSLPSFENLNEDFQIEKVCCEETELVLKEISKIMGEKFSSYHRLVETLVNPTNAPFFVFFYD